MVDPRENRIHMYLSDEEKEAIDNWRFENRIATRSDAIRRLCQIGLITDAKVTPIANDLKQLSTAISGYGELVADLMSAHAKGEIFDRGGDLVLSSMEAGTSLSKLAFSLRELNGQTHNLRENRDFDEVMDGVRQVTQTFKSTHARMDGVLSKIKGDREHEEIVADEAKEVATASENRGAAIRKLDYVLNDIVREVARAMEVGGFTSTEKPAIQNRIAEAHRQLDLLNAKILGNG